MLDILIVGAGGFGRELHGWLWDCFSQEEYRLKGFLSQDAHALDSFGLESARSMMIGDRDQDINGARENGLRSLAVLWGFGSKEELEAAAPDHLADRSMEIMTLLTGTPGRPHSL